MYRILFSLFLSRLDPERAHELAFRVIRMLPVTGIGVVARLFCRPPRGLEVNTLGLRFDSPFGMAAGFDKNGTGVRGLGQLGFGHVEVGTVTAISQPGNDKPRLFRLVADRALVNRMGFNNHGAAVVAGRLATIYDRKRRPVIGVNVGKSRVVDVEDAISDYVESTRLLAPVADYLAVNVSSPNTPGLRGLQQLDKLEPLLVSVHAAAGKTPVLVKIAPDLTNDEVRQIAELAVRLGLSGMIATNTTLSRENLETDAAIVAEAGAGGLSGRPVAARAIELLEVIRQVVPPDFCVISVGGIETAAEVDERLRAGATLVQGYTGFVYRGPLWARRIGRGLARLRRAGEPIVPLGGNR